jgi:glycosyltransferase involved in cell wall biosynthesis
MRIVVYPHVLELGGSQLNAIELAAGVRDLGHDVVVFGQPGPLRSRIDAMGLEFVTAPRPRGRPSPWVMKAMGDLIARRRVDVVHGYEWTTALEAYWGAQVRFGVPAVATVMSMAVAPFIPHDLSLVVGTEQIADHERGLGRPDVHVIEPPVDLAHNAPGAVDADAFRRAHRLDPDALTVVCVTRLAAELKLEGLLAAIDAAADLAPEAPVQLVVVGDGPVRAQVEAHAARANARAGRRAVVLTGSLDDPRPAYAAADVCLGMGGSALRALAFARPLVVQGEHGFWELLTPGTFERFAWTGWYGVGDGAAHGSARLAAILRDLAGDPGRRTWLGAYGLKLVQDRFSLARAAGRQLEIYERAGTGVPRDRRQRITVAAPSAAGITAYRTRRRVDDLLGRASTDDFNSRPVAALATRAGAGRA